MSDSKQVLALRDGRRLQRLRAELASLRAQEAPLCERAKISRLIDQMLEVMRCAS